MAEKKDYVIAQVKGTAKPFLFQVTSVDDGGKSLNGILEDERRTKLKPIEVRTKDVLVNLGPAPKPGKVYNLDVSNLYRTTVNHEWWGGIHFYTKPDPATMKVLKNALDRTASILDKHKLEPFVEHFDTEIRAKHGKWAGMYVHRPKERNKVWYAPECAELNSKQMDYIIYHEFGHAIRYNGIKGAVKLRQKWQRLYQESIRPVVIPAKAHAILWTKLTEAHDKDPECGFSEALKDIASENEKYERAIKVILKWIKQVHHLGTKELSLAWAAEDTAYLRDVWPTGPIDSSDLSPVISEYATKNAEELFAECFAFYMTKQELPDEYTKLLEKSISYAKASVGKED